MNSEHKELIARLEAQISEYWDLAYVEGLECRKTDNRAGDAGRCWHAIQQSIQALTSKPAEVGVPVIPTDEMVNAGCMALQGSIGGYEAGQIYTAWKAMLLAAPTKPDSEAVQLTVCCGREECGGECGNEWRGLEWVRKAVSASDSKPSQPVGNAGEVLAAKFESDGRAALAKAVDQNFADWVRDGFRGEGQALLRAAKDLRKTFIHPAPADEVGGEGGAK